MMKHSRGYRRGLLACALVMAAQGADAAMLDKPECDALTGELAQLVSVGVRVDMQRGPDWAKANLAPERLLQVKRLIEIEEQLVFRCKPVAPPVEAKADVNPADGKAQPKTKARAKGKKSASADDDYGLDLSGVLPDPEPAPKPKAKTKAKAKSKAAKRSAAKKSE